MSQNRPLNETGAGGRPGPVSLQLIPKYGLVVLLVAFTGLGLLYDFTVPFFEKPDELKHFAVIQYIQTRRQLPVVQAGVYQPWDQEGTQPPLYHLLAAAATSWLDLSNFEEPPRNPHYADERSFVWRERGNNNLYLHPPGERWSTQPVFLAARIARWLSLVAGLGTVFLTYLLARTIFVWAGSPAESPPVFSQLNNNLLPLLAAAFIAFTPQFLHVSSAITNDSLSTTLAAATLVSLVLIIRQGSSTRYAIYLGLLLGLGAITKLSLLYLLPLTGLVLLFDLGRHRSFRRLLWYGGLVGGLVLLLSGWWYWRNWQLYGDMFALNAHLLYRGGALTPRPSLTQIWQTELTGLELSFWAAFGAGQILLEPWIYEILGWVKYLLLIGLIIGFGRIIRNQVTGRHQATLKRQYARPHIQLAQITLLALWPLIIFLALLRWMQITPASWGRLLYPALPAIGVLLTWSLSQLSIPRIPSPSGQSSAPKPPPSPPIPQSPSPNLHSPISHPQPVWLTFNLLLVAMLFLLSLVSPFRYTHAAYGKPPLISEAEIPTKEIEQLNFIYGDKLRLIGYRVQKTAVQPGEWLPVTLYWQALQPLTKNYSAFVHLLGQDNEVVGQVNTYPGRGNWPTSMLEPGKVLKDSYYIPVSAEAEAPAIIRLAMGIFEFEDPARTAKVAVNATGEVVDPIVGAVPLLPPEWPRLKPDHPLEANFAGQIKLVGYDWPGETNIKPGKTVPLTLYWETLASPGQDLILFIHLVDPTTGDQVAGFDGPPDFPTGFWQPGYTIIDSRHLPLPPDLPPGKYHLQIGWYNLETLGRLPVVNKPGDTVQLLTVILGR